MLQLFMTQRSIEDTPRPKQTQSPKRKVWPGSFRTSLKHVKQQPHVVHYYLSCSGRLRVEHVGSIDLLRPDSCNMICNNVRQSPTGALRAHIKCDYSTLLHTLLKHLWDSVLHMIWFRIGAYYIPESLVSGCQFGIVF